jgi:hypothetical protein
MSRLSTWGLVLCAVPEPLMSVHCDPAGCVVLQR